jgi:hypothetical protein
LALDSSFGIRISFGLRVSAFGFGQELTGLGDLLAHSRAAVFFAFLVLKGVYYASRS